MTEVKTKEMPTVDVLSTITGRLIGEIGGVYEVLNWMTGESVFTHQIPRISREAQPVIIAVPTRDRDDYLIGEAYFLEDDDGWWWAGNGPGDYHGGPISEINYHLPEYWQPLPAKPASRADRTLENTNG